MSRITHFKQQPMNIEFWDYYILCHLNSDVALALQRMEYWDGTKDESNTHAEAMNDAAIKAGQLPTQDTSNWIYKSLDELQWELLGAAGEKRLTKVLNFLVDDLKYLRRRNNPLEGWDRKKQYEFKASHLQEHINYLGYIIGSFNLPMRHLRPVFYAIEVLTSEGTDIDSLSVEKVLAKIEQLKNEPKAPHFLKGDLEKWGQFCVSPPGRSFRTFAEWKAHICGMHSAESRNGKRRIAECIPHMCGSNSIEDTYETNIKDKQRERNAELPNTQSADADMHTSLSVEDMIACLQSQGYAVTLQAEPASTERKAPPLVNVSTEDQDHLKPVSPPPISEVNHKERGIHTDSSSPGRKDDAPAEKNQEKLLPSAPIKPEMPPNDMPWGHEKMVQLTECLRWCRGERGATFSPTPTGKNGKSQRDRQLSAAKKILAELPTLTEAEYVQAYSDQNNEWWNREKGSLTVEDMAANTPRKVMRMVELLEKVRTRSERIKERPPSPVGGACTQLAVQHILSPEELSKIPILF